MTLFERIAANHTDEFYAVDKSTGSLRVLTAEEFNRGEADGTLDADHVYMSLDQALGKSAEILGRIFGNN